VKLMLFMKLQVGVKVYLENDENKYPILQRSGEIYPEAQGLWDIPRGRINPGESLISALKRELKEETGLKLISTPKIIFAQDILRKDKGIHIVRLTYFSKIKSGEVVLDKEHRSFKWLNLKDLLAFKTLDPYAREVIESGSLKN